MKRDTEPVGDLMSVMLTGARAHAVRWNLVGEDGFLWCARCVNAHALMPSLHCGTCLGDYYARNGIVQPACLNTKQPGSEQ